MTVQGAACGMPVTGGDHTDGASDLRCGLMLALRLRHTYFFDFFDFTTAHCAQCKPNMCMVCSLLSVVHGSGPKHHCQLGSDADY